jgi:hypothetical protein
MTTIKKLLLPIPQSGCGNTRLTSDGADLSIEFEYRIKENDLIGVIHFEGVAAYRFTNEHNLSKFDPLSYESLAEIVPACWNEEKRATSEMGSPYAPALRHFALLLSSNGYFEILARSFRVGKERPGLLP